MTEGIFEKRFLMKQRQWTAVAADMRAAAPLRELKMALVRREDPTSASLREVDALATQLGIRPLGENWTEIDAATADPLVRRMLGYRLYGGDPILEPIETQATSEHLVETFKHRPRYFTSVLAFDDEGLTSWTPISDAPFDAVFVGIDNDFVGMVAVMERPDED